MPFVSKKDARERYQMMTPYEYVEVPEFSEVFAASVGQVIDEDLSISSYLNNEMFAARGQKIRKLRDDGFDVDSYIDQQGKIDTARLSVDTNQDIPSDEMLREQRNNMLKQRRDYSNDVIERGSGFAQFFGMVTGVMLDPVNMATYPLASAGVAAKGLGVIGSALSWAKREAAIATVAELAIQPLVYQHKHDIDSPYSVGDAIGNIAVAAIGAATLGGVVGGLSGYFRKVKAKSEPLIAPEPDSTESMVLNTFERLADDIDAIKQETIYTKIANDYAAIRKSDELYVQDATREFKESKAKLISDIEKEIKGFDKDTKLGKRIAQYGGLNQKAWSAESGLNKKEFGTLKGDVRKPFWRSGEAGLTPDELAEKLVEDGYISGYDQREAIAFVEDLLRAGDRIADPDSELRLAELNDNLEMLSRVADEELDEFYQQAIRKDMEDDIQILQELESKRELFSAPSRAYENYLEPTPQKALSATVTDRERDILTRNGWDEDYDAIMQEYKNLEDPIAFIDDEFVDANEYIKAVDEEIEGINSVLECALG